ncbi:MAG TPA: hypothetical protein VIY52_34675 [Streptosporangiaceae bacterium]
MHDASHLTHDSHHRTVLMQGAKQRHRVEPDRIIGGGGPGDIVRVIMTQPAPLPAGGRRTQPPHSLFQPPDGKTSDITLQHPLHTAVPP